MFLQFFFNFECMQELRWLHILVGIAFCSFKKILWNRFTNNGYSTLCERPSALLDIRVRRKAPLRGQEPLTPCSWYYTVVSVSWNSNLLLSCNGSCKISWVYLCGDVLYLFQWDGLTFAQTKVYLNVLPMHGLPGGVTVCAVSRLWAPMGKFLPRCSEVWRHSRGLGASRS